MRITERESARCYIKINGKTFARSRIVWEMHNGPIPENLFIDHINGVKSDDRIENLRIVTNQVNAMNQSTPKNNKSGVIGVSRDGNKWRAIIVVSYKHITVYHGASFEDAVSARKKAETDYGFHENHGRKQA
jgi:hypothetical protein